MTAVKTFQSVVERLESENASLRIERDAIKLYTADKIDRLTAEVARVIKANEHWHERLKCLTAERDTLMSKLNEAHQYRTGHLPSCRGSDPADGRCECGYLDGTAYRELVDERDTLRIFAQYVLAGWPDDDVGGGELQDKAVELGLLEQKIPLPRESCGEGCRCADYYSESDFRDGQVVCYKRTALLMEENV